MESSRLETGGSEGYEWQVEVEEGRRIKEGEQRAAASADLFLCRRLSLPTVTVSYPEQISVTVIKVVWREPLSCLSFCDKWGLQLMTDKPSGRLFFIHIMNMYNTQTSLASDHNFFPWWCNDPEFFHGTAPQRIYFFDAS